MWKAKLKEFWEVLPLLFWWGLLVVAMIAAFE